MSRHTNDVGNGDAKWLRTVVRMYRAVVDKHDNAAVTDAFPLGHQTHDVRKSISLQSTRGKCSVKEKLP